MKIVGDTVELVCDICAYLVIFAIVTTMVDIVIERAESTVYLDYVRFLLWFGAGVVSYKVNKLLQSKIS